MQSLRMDCRGMSAHSFSSSRNGLSTTNSNSSNSTSIINCLNFSNASTRKTNSNSSSKHHYINSTNNNNSSSSSRIQLLSTKAATHPRVKRQISSLIYDP